MHKDTIEITKHTTDFTKWLARLSDGRQYVVTTYPRSEVAFIQHSLSGRIVNGRLIRQTILGLLANVSAGEQS